MLYGPFGKEKNLLVSLEFEAHTLILSDSKSNRHFFLWRCGPKWAMASSFLRVLDHTQRRITVGRTPLDV